jgi:hypothetical protein
MTAATHWTDKVDRFRLQEAGGGNARAMPRRSTAWSQLADDGMA